MALAEVIFFIGNALSMVDDYHSKRAWNRRGSGFSTPSYHVMRNDLLEKCYANVKERVERVILDNLSLSGCTIVSDGWSNVQCALINIMVVSPRGETFIKAIDSSGMIKT